MRLLLDQNLCSTAHVAALIVAHVEQIEAFAADPGESVLLLG